jgi:hypothetical protein
MLCQSNLLRTDLYQNKQVHLSVNDIEKVMRLSKLDYVYIFPSAITHYVTLLANKGSLQNDKNESHNNKMELIIIIIQLLFICLLA